MARLIDADALLESVDKERQYLIARGQKGAEHILVHNFRDLIDNAPTVEKPTGEWIPVNERLPEGKIDPMTNDLELVLCSTVWEVVRPYKFGKPMGHSKAHFWSGGGIMDDYVIAWMPLPEAYKEEE